VLPLLEELPACCIADEVEASSPLPIGSKGSVQVGGDGAEGLAHVGG